MWAAVLSVILGLAVNECCEVSPWVAKKIARWSVRLRYDDPERAETRGEELVALIGERPGKLLKLITAMWFAAAALRAWVGRAVAGLYVGIPAVSSAGAVVVKKAAVAAVAGAVAFAGVLGIEMAVTRGLILPTAGTSASHAVGFPIVLQVPPETGASVGVTVEALRNLDPNMTYLIIEKIPNVDPTNPHAVYFVKAAIPYLHADQVSSRIFQINEPVGTRAEFFAVGVDNGSLDALSENQVIDNGLLFLPNGTLMESATTWHLKDSSNLSNGIQHLAPAA